MDGNERSIVAFASSAHALVHTYELSIPIFVVVWLQAFGASTAELGLAVTGGYALFGIGALPGGILADRFGSRRLVAAGVAGMGASFLALSFANGLVAVALALAGWGVAASVYHPAALSLLSTGVESRGTAFAYHGMAGNAGIALGPLVSALLLLAFDWPTVVRLLVLPAVAVAGYAAIVEFDEMAAVDASARGSDAGGPGRAVSLSSVLADSRALLTAGFVLALAVVMANGLFYRGTLTFLPEMLGEFLPPIDPVGVFGAESALAAEFDTASYLYAGLLMVGIAGQYTGGKLSDRVPPTLGLVGTFAALVVIAVAFVPAARVGLVPLLAASVLLGFFLFALQPLYQATIAVYTPPDGRGLSYGYTYLVSFGVGAAGATIAGYLLSALGTGGTFLALSVFPVLGAGFALTLYRWDPASATNG
ncbi:MFS transporter [Halapricum hydrolyticum]|uniref:MFS transporter n=1 Tax=Halapricum hydrolyticum TaxID=2979991 RepID=A0AAE3IET6_9EURY|nr:MFS transporter [Halapricum hydrolyticum]MCU4719415.1 MFS transporter [Halapricum hydrolyticum]MCU4728424.1 MFS transporter [Halapricum hydrolyticum]